jgi:predicted O-linked N-acetylglucosamine transferase (SPINDLY family)/glycosyltransferase involved in cell wall biosynthesis
LYSLLKFRLKWGKKNNFFPHFSVEEYNVTEHCQLTSSHYQQKIESLLNAQNYTQGICEVIEWTENFPQEKKAYAYLGLFHLLKGNEEDAQSAWMTPCLEFQEEKEFLEWMQDIALLLKREGEIRINNFEFPVAWTIYQHCHEIIQQDIYTILRLLQLAIEVNVSPIELLENFLTLDRLVISPEMADFNLLISVLEVYLKPENLSIAALDFIEFCESVFYVNIPASIYSLMRSAVDYASRSPWLDPSIRLTSLALKLDPQNFEALGHLSGFYYSAQMYDEGIQAAITCLETAKTIPQKIHAHSMVMRGVMGKGGEWTEAITIFEKGQEYFNELLNAEQLELNQSTSSCMFNAAFFHPYVCDKPASTRKLQNKVSEICHSVTQFYAEESVTKYATSHAERLNYIEWPMRRRLKVGYLCHCFRSHSVGWLSRWLIQYHDCKQFEVYGYFVAHRTGVVDPLQSWYEVNFEHVRMFGVNAQEIADSIAQDELDILIDLDSITLDISYAVMAMKPAPIQASWLGLDASGLPSIDYFIADQYVLPEVASDYYHEKIVRLPFSYLAVEGFEVDKPNITREELLIPNDAVIFLSCQSGLKRNIETVRCQLQIISAVPNSYFLIKGIADQKSVSDLFQRLAIEMGIDVNRLRFLPNTPSEAIHRANLTIADVVLDTYPYNGATTTMETLWMEIPIVTRVGEQFAARNSYTMMINAGVSEGIARSAEEYVSWGIRLGTDTNLRDQIRQKLRNSKQTSPLWDAPKFTQYMEAAYQSMYKSWVDKRPLGNITILETDLGLQDVDKVSHGPVLNVLAPSDEKIIIDGVFFQLYKTGVARLWHSLLEVWAEEEFRNNIIILDRDQSCQRIPGLMYRDVPPFSYDNIEADRELLQSICDQEEADLFISTYYTIPTTTRSVFMGYDMIPEILGWDLRHLMWVSKQVSIDHASAYITISESTARDLEKLYPHVVGSPIIPALCGVAPYFYPSSSSEKMAFRDRFNLRKPYFLLIGPSMGYKNAELFLNGFSKLVSRHGFDVICTGGSAPEFSAEARRLIPDVIFHALSLNDEELRAAYSGAIALVYPSKYEGFGLPIGEAMKCDCPVITCAKASLPEVGGDAVLYVGDDDPDGMANALLEIQRPDTRHQLISLGREQSKKFTWKKMGNIIKQCLLEQAHQHRMDHLTPEHNVLVLIDWQAGEETLLTSTMQFLHLASELQDLETYQFLIDLNGNSIEDVDTILSSGVISYLMENDSTELEKLRIKFLTSSELINFISSGNISKICLRDVNDLEMSVREILDFVS